MLSEKPLSDSTDGLDDLVALAAAEGKKVMVAHCFRYHDGLLKAKKALDAGRIGRLVSVRAMVGEHLPDVRPDYRSLFSAQHGGAFDLMHDIDLALWYAGLPVRQVYALSGSYSDIGIIAPDVAEILIGFEGPCLATVHLDFFQRPRRRQIELIGTDGVILVEFARLGSLHGLELRGCQGRNGSTKSWSPTATTCSAPRIRSSSMPSPMTSRSTARSPRRARQWRLSWRPCN